VAKHYDLTVPGHPVAKERPRLARNGGVHTPPKTVQFEKMVGNAWFDKYGETRLEGMVQVWLYFGTKTHSRQDVDNLAKSVLDGLERANAFEKGDQQVYKLTASKFPSDVEQTIICIRAMMDYALPD
jgi:Holliday junction resolvase RusA-like endonuclease